MKRVTYILLIIFLLLNSGIQMFGQKKALISGGIGFAEMINIGVKYQVSQQSQIGLSIGMWPPSDDWLFNWNSLISISGDFYYHIGGSSEYTEISPWYIRMGLVYIRVAGEDYIDNNLESHLRFGRDFNFSEDIGISLDAGVAAFLKNETGFTSVLPVFGTSLFFRF